jgi:adenine-specific DNA-methyltransferase
LTPLTEIDAIAARYQPEIDRLLEQINHAMGKELKEWEIPRVLPDDWNEQAKVLHRQFREVKLRKKKEIDESIQLGALQETLYDRPKVKRGIVRVSGPFTVEAIPMPVIADPEEPSILEFEEQEPGPLSSSAGDYLSNMIELLSKSGVVFPGGKRLELTNLRPLSLGILHAEAEIKEKEQRVAVSFGPQYGPVTAQQLSEAIPVARANGYRTLIMAGFSFDAGAQDFKEKVPLKDLSVHFANISPDVLIGDLLKTPTRGQLFTVFGQPDVRLYRKNNKDEWLATDTGEFLLALQKGNISPDAQCRVEVRGVDIYDPNTGECQNISAAEVAAWFLDPDYNGKVFHICQAFFPNGGKNPWDKLGRALGGKVSKEKIELLRGTVSFPFIPGDCRRIAVKVIDFRGNEVIRVLPVSGGD